MVKFSSYHYINPKEVESVSVCKTESEYPYDLKVRMKSGKELVVSYIQICDRDRARDNLIIDIQRALREEQVSMSNVLTRIENELHIIDKRQLRVWRQLKQLLGISIEED